MYDQFREMSTDELVEKLPAGEPGSPMAETVRTLVYVRAVQSLTNATNELRAAQAEAASASSKLQRALNWYTAIIAMATAASVVVAIVTA